MTPDPIVTHVLTFLKKNATPSRGILLALSGGPDSLALLYLLLECQKEFPFDLAIAHVDHGWRKESREEQEQLAQLASSLSIPFHARTLDPSEMQGNLEAACRRARLDFFASLCQSYAYQAVVLGHQQEDQTETVLKRILEGASFPFCKGMTGIVRLDSLTLWRPMLPFPKKSLVDWLNQRGIVPFYDPTNHDSRFLRARIRKDILPYLEASFGKSASRSLACAGNEAQELSDFLERHLQPIFGTLATSALGSYVDLAPFLPLSPFEVKYIVRKVCQKEECFPSREIVHTAAHHLLTKTPNRRFRDGRHLLFVDRGTLFAVEVAKLHLPELLVPLEDRAVFGSWQLSISRARCHARTASLGWRELWKGCGAATLSLEEGPYHLGPARMNSPYPGKTGIGKWWNDHKIPAFLRDAVPVVWKNGKITHEFLTGKTVAKQQNKENSYLLLQFKQKYKGVVSES